jgi:hypothetical protein
VELGLWGGFIRKSERGKATGKRKGKEFHDEEEWENAQNAAHTMCLRIMPPAFLAFLEERKTTRDQMKISSFILFRK